MQTVTITFHAEFVLPDERDQDDYYDTPEGVREWYADTLREAEGCTKVYAHLADRPMPDPDEIEIGWMPADIQIAIDRLAEWGAGRCVYEHPRALETWIAGAVQAQVEDPDYEQAEELARDNPHLRGDER
jgi:hypothetical protein